MLEAMAQPLLRHGGDQFAVPQHAGRGIRMKGVEAEIKLIKF